MRPRSLELEGFTAFRDRQRVDFEPLDLFVITGPTGAGKTSILDAMVFALFGQVPRLGGKQGTADLVSLGQVEARIKFEFSITGKGRYRVARRLSRRAAQSATLERHEGEKWVPACERGVRECDRVLVEMLGLDFDSFCKAVVLPQGEFDRFLKGDPKERRQVLVSLLGVGYFQKMGDTARRRSRDLTAGVERTEEILADQYADATPERVKELGDAAANTRERAARLTETLSQAEQRTLEATEHERRGVALAAQGAELAGVAGELGKQASVCAEAEVAGERAAKALVQAETQVAAAREALASADAASELIQTELGTLEQLAELAAAAGNMRTATSEREQAHTDLTERETQLASAMDAASKAAQRDVDARSAVAAARDAHERSAAKAQKAAERARELRQTATNAERAHAELDTAREKLTVAELAATDAQAAADRARGTLVEAVEHLRRHRHANVVAELAVGLAVGDPCPVCTRELTEPVAVADDIRDVLEMAQAAETAARDRADAASTLAAQTGESARSAAERLQTAGERFREALGGHPDVAALRDALEDAVETEGREASELADLAQAIEEAAKAQADAGELRVAAHGELQRCQALVASAKRALELIEERRGKAVETVAAYFVDEPPEDASEQIADRRARVANTVDAARAARTKLDGLTDECDSLRRDSGAAQRRLGELDLALARLRARAESAARAVGELLGDDTKVGQAPAPEGPRDAANRALAGWCRNGGATVARAVKSAAEAGDIARRCILELATGSAVEVPDGGSPIELLREAERDASNATARAQSNAEQAAKRAEERSQLEERVRGEREQIVVLSALAQELRADHFGEYLVQETLDLLAVYASQELQRISAERYSLVPVEGDFHVVDHANADERRSVKTLSGGETFLASLSLALALSRHVGELATEGLGAKLEAVFIDEGFGTLDPETLEEVIDALERLRADDLMVGVISHVPALAQRVRAGLEVHAEQGRSTITSSIAA